MFTVNPIVPRHIVRLLSIERIFWWVGSWPTAPTPIQEDQVILNQGCLPLAFDEPNIRLQGSSACWSMGGISVPSYLPCLGGIPYLPPGDAPSRGYRLPQGLQRISLSKTFYLQSLCTYMVFNNQEILSESFVVLLYTKLLPVAVGENLYQDSWK